MPPPDSAVQFQGAQAARIRLVMLAVRREWARARTTSLLDAWLSVIGPRITVLVAAGQTGAVKDGDAYVSAVLEETGQEAELAGQPQPSRMIGVAPDGRELPAMMYGSVVATQTALAEGKSWPEAFSAGGSWLDMAVQTVIADAGRGAASLGIAARPRVAGYVRMVHTPCCSRCAVLAGSWYRYNTGFERHRNCQCVHIPASENIAGDLRTNPDRLWRDGQIKDLTKAEQQALEDGADLAQLVNAKRDMQTAQAFGRDVKTTTAGTTSRGGFGRLQTDLAKRPGSRYRTTSVPRLMPESIYRLADDREHAIRLLRMYGWIT